MFTQGVAQYFEAGLSAMNCINEALQQAGNTTVNNILDMPSGYGRVLRLLAQRFPKARITACDVIPDAIRFCAETFRATPAQSSFNFDELSFSTKFDLIWCGSLVTHLDADGARALLRLFSKHLTAEGLLVLTTHGDHVPTIFDRYNNFGVNSAEVPQLLEAFHEQGFGYDDDPAGYGYPGYGFSLTARTWMIAEALEIGLKEVYFRAKGWDDFQDVFGFVKDSSM
jgi:SAM-dependent methyltransferase